MTLAEVPQAAQDMIDQINSYPQFFADAISWGIDASKKFLLYTSAFWLMMYLFKR